MKQIQKIGLCLALIFSLQGQQIFGMGKTDQFLDSLKMVKLGLPFTGGSIGATVGAAAGLATFATISATDYGILYFKKRRGGERCNLDSIEIPSDCAEQRNLYSQNVKNIAAHKLTGEELKKAQPYHYNAENIYWFKKTNTGFLHKTYTQGTISGTITTISDAEQKFQPNYLCFDQSTIHNRRWKHAFCGALIIGGAIAGAYVVGNITQK